MQKEAAADQYFKSYEEYSRSLRTWLVAYGVGGPVLFLSNPTAAEALRGHAETAAIIILFMTGVALQIGLASTNKALMWLLYFGEHHPEFKAGAVYKGVDWLSEQFWIDMLVDFCTVGVFVVATAKIFLAVLVR